MSYLLIRGDARRIPLADGSVHCVVTSPPYFGLRDYGCAGQIGLEETPEQYVSILVDVFREVRRVLRDDGVVWLNLGDSYNSMASNQNGRGLDGKVRGGNGERGRNTRVFQGLASKQLLGIPWRVAFALQADGWYLRADCVWAKLNPIPESVRDRPTKSHEYVFLLAKSERYYYDPVAIEESAAQSTRERAEKGYMIGGSDRDVNRNNRSRMALQPFDASPRNRRSVWTIASAPCKGAHFAVMPPKLAAPCIKAGTSRKGCCPRCGAPWRRRVRKVRIATRHVRDTRTVGWESTCTCGVYSCSNCDYNVSCPLEGDMEHAVQRPRGEAKVRTGKIRKDVRRRSRDQQGESGEAQEAQEDLRALQRGIHGGGSGSVLQQELHGEMDVGERPGELVPGGTRGDLTISQGLQALQLQGSQEDDLGIRRGPCSRTSDGQFTGVCPGTSEGHVGSPREGPGGQRDCPPQERHQVGQQVGEPGDPLAEHPQPLPLTSVSALRKALQAKRCPRCGGELTHKPYDPVPCVVLDPFGGAGTTPLVATALGRHAVALDLKPEYLALARRRIERPHARPVGTGQGADLPLFAYLEDP